MSKSRHQQTASISHIVDSTVRHANGELLGYVDELLIDLASGRIEYVIVNGARGQRLRFPWASISIEDNGFVLQRSGPQLVVNDGSSGPQC